MATLEVDIEEITTMIWRNLFDLPLDRVDTAPSDRDPAVTGLVSIDGAWEGAVMLRCPMALAVTLTTAMFQESSTPDVADICDALGELTNIVAGNVKVLLPSPCNLSLPAVALGSDYALNIPGTTPLARASFTCDCQPLTVTLLQQLVEKGAPA